MSFTEKFSCNVCGKERGASNHWTLAVVDERGLALYPWKDSDARLEGMQHLCGRSCVQRLIDKALDSTPFAVVPKPQQDGKL